MDVVEDLGGCDDARLAKRPIKLVLIPAAVVEVELAKERGSGVEKCAMCLRSNGYFSM